jgi:alpha-L-rhamnosidase
MRQAEAVRTFRICVALLLGLFLLGNSASVNAGAKNPKDLRTDSLNQPLGIDSPKPSLSWRLQDDTPGARQTAYEILVYSKWPAAIEAKPDIWDSGRVASSISTGVPYGGPELQPEKRYFWRVKLWDRDGKPYPFSEITWWETGLLSQSKWQGKWIGYEEPELHRLRESGAKWITNSASEATEPNDTQHDFRYAFNLDRPVQSAVLYATGADTTTAWINGRQVMQSQPLNPWQQMPWQTYSRANVTESLRSGANLLAITVTRFQTARQKQVSTRTPMSACLLVAFTDGSTALFTSGVSGWKAALHAPDGWWRDDFSDASWKAAEPYTPDPGGFDGPPGLPWPTGPVAVLRHNFREGQAIASARLYATALGAYKFRINGDAVGDQILAPGWTDYRQQVLYQVYDVTAQIKPGNNAIAAYLAPGWYSTPLRWFRQGNNYGNSQPALRAQLRLEHTDGSVEWIATDENWKADFSPILQAELYDGETFDARKVQDGWDTASFSDANWQHATLVNPNEPRILAQYFQPIRTQLVLSAKTITNIAPGVYVFDFGQNMSALPRLRVNGVRGDDVKLRFAEVLNSDGTLYVDNLRTAKATDHFILAGKKTGEDFQPEFTFHGFRYAEVSGLRDKPTTETLKAVVLHTDAPFTMRFSTGNSMVNQLWNNILWGQRSNFVGVPTDCPQRDERLGWSADAQVFWRTASYNMDLSTFSGKYAADLRGTQTGTPMYGIYAPGVEAPNPSHGAAWSDAGVIVPWTAWIQTGDRRIVDENWEGMEKYLAEIAAKNPNHLWQNGFGIPFGDWLTPTITTPEDVLATAYWAYDVSLMKQMALATGRTADVERYTAQFDQIKDAFQKAYIRADGFVGTVDHYPSFPPPTVHPDEGNQDKNRVVETQTGYVLALHMNLVPDGLRQAAAEKLVGLIKNNRWRLGTGFLGTPYLLGVLADTGYSDVAYRLLLNREYPSWGYSIDHGGTTTWERWNGDQMLGDPSMNSYNHYAYGAVGEWLYRYAAGVDTVGTDPGFHTIYLHPNFDARLGSLLLDYESPFGTIHSEWNVQGNQATWKVTVPPNATALLSPRATNAVSITFKGLALEKSEFHADSSGRFELPSGSYSFVAVLGKSSSDASGTHN